MNQLIKDILKKGFAPRTTEARRKRPWINTLYDKLCSILRRVFLLKFDRRKGPASDRSALECERDRDRDEIECLG